MNLIQNLASVGTAIALAASGIASATQTPAPLPVAASEAFDKQQSAPHLLPDPDYFIRCFTAMRWTDERIHAYYAR